MTKTDTPYHITRIAHGSTLKKSVVNEMWVCRMAEGEAVVQFNQREYTVRKGDAFVVGDIKNTLLTTDLNFQQVAERFAFPDQSAFGQYFRRHTGMSLTEFRKKR